MGSSIKNKLLHIGGMTCVSCQNKIERKLSNTAGIKSAKVSYNAGTAEVTYDQDIITLKDIDAIIERLGYTVVSTRRGSDSGKKSVAGVLLVIASLYLLLQHFGILNLLVPSKLAETNMSYGMLFVIGLLTSVHCVAMCGGINISQCISTNQGEAGKSGALATLRPALLYNLGRVLSYTAIGFIVGGLGSTIAFSNTMQGILKVIAGLIMVMMGINMLGIFPWLRRFSPRIPAIFARRIDGQKAASKSPFLVGLLNGLMPCGPLQSMQIYALSTGSAFAGAFSMLLFSLGTVPLMLGLGALSSALGKKFTSKVMTAGSVLVVVLGIAMFSQGWSLSGLPYPSLFAGSAATPAVTDTSVKGTDTVQLVNSTLSPGRYPAITVQAGTPVKWVIVAPQGSINGCNNRIFIPAYGLEYSFKTGENIIEFTPSQTGTFPFSCWMGMIRGTITVVDADTEIPPQSGTSDQTVPQQGGLIGEPVPADYVIPTDQLAIAEHKDTFQQVTIELTDEGFQPAVVVVQSDMETEWIINNTSSKYSNFSLLVPYYASQVSLAAEANPLYLYPTDDFEFSNGDGSYFGYVKVVEDISSIDAEAIRQEVSDFETVIWPPQAFGTTGGGAPSCH